MFGLLPEFFVNLLWSAVQQHLFAFVINGFTVVFLNQYLSVKHSQTNLKNNLKIITSNKDIVKERQEDFLRLTEYINQICFILP